MPLVVGDIVRVTCNFELQNAVQYQNVYHYIFDGVGGVPDAVVVDDIETKLQSAYANLQGHVNVGVSPQLSSVDQVEWSVDEWVVIANLGTFTITFIPTQVSDPLPNQDSYFVVLKTPRPKSVGRKFLFPPSEEDQDAGIIVPTLVANIVGYTNVVIDDIVLDVLNELHPGIVRTSVNDFLLYTVGVVTNLTGSQRRRRPGYGG